MTKYGNKKTAVILRSGAFFTFDSKREADRFTVLRALAAEEKIRRLKLQPEFTLVEAFTDVSTGKRIQAMRYRADFSYYEGGNLIVEDAKGVRTKDYELKRKLMLDRYGITIKEI